jgi:hypothetical protein
VTDDYLWDRRGPVDPEVTRLETLLAPLRPHRLPPLPVARPPQRRIWPALLLAVAASAVMALGAAWWWQVPAVTLHVTRVAGVPTIGSAAVTHEGALAVGRWLETDSSARATIDVASIGRVEIDPDTRISVVGTAPGDYRLQLAHGTLHALIWAAPGRFAVDTPGATTVDLGCAYTLTVDPDGTGLVRVTSGWVGFTWHGRESFVPAGALCPTHRGRGPGTPFYEDVPDPVRHALETLDEGTASAPDREAALSVVLSRARAEDVVTLWHLLSRVDAVDRDRVYDRLAAFVSPPAGVTREGIQAGNRAMLDAWWNSLGLGTASWWRTWTQTWRE